MSALRKGCKILGGLVVGLIVVVFIIFEALQSGMVREWLAAVADRALSDGTTTVHVGTIEGTVPFDMRLSELRLSDADGECLAVRDVAFAVRRRELLRGRLEISRLSAADIAI